MLNFLGNLFSTLWNAFIGLFDWLAAFVIEVASFFLNLIVDTLFAVMYVFIAILPDMPQADHSGMSSLDALAFANNYFPVSEAIALLPLLGTIFAAIGVYKLIKFISPISS